MRPNTLIQVSKPNTIPLELKTVKQYLKITHKHDDELLNMLIFAVSSKCEAYTGLSLINKDWRAQYLSYARELHLPVRPLLRVNDLKVVHKSSGSSMIISPTLYRFADDHLFMLVNLPHGKLNVYFTAGFGEKASDIPASLRMTMINHVADLYETRGLKSNFTMDEYDDYRLYKI
jgi:uncharacterized phiE125 gp8 family phage protein